MKLKGLGSTALEVMERLWVSHVSLRAIKL